MRTPGRRREAVAVSVSRSMEDDAPPIRSRARALLYQDYELSYWSEKLGVSRDKVREVVAKAGPMVRNVERELRGNG